MMKQSRKLVVSIMMLLIGGSSVMNRTLDQQKSGAGHQLSLRAKINRFAPTTVTAEVSRLSAGDRKALPKIIEAAKLMDQLFLRQVWSGNEALLKKLEADSTADGKDRLHYFGINFGPWSRLDENEPFIQGVPAKPAAANYYPENMTKDEFNRWVESLSETEKQKATGFFYTIRREASGKLKAVPYSEEYRDMLEPAAKLLREAAELTDNTSLQAYLRKRAAAFLSNDYYESDIAWLELDAPIDLTIGPYETYEDGLFGYKAAFEAFVTLRDAAETAKLQKFSQHLQEIENNLPIDNRYKNPKLGAATPIRVVNELFVAGDTKAGVQTAAFNLPNDERVIKEKGAKRVMLKNVQEAKFKQILQPIAKVVLPQSHVGDVAFEPFFTHILAHELMHGLGPHGITVGGKVTTVRQQLKELYSAVEEAKADITGLFALQYLIDKGVVEKSMERQMYVTFLASAFRSVRFGITEAHGRGVALQFNYLMDRGAFKFDTASGTFSVDWVAVKPAVTELSREILTAQAEGSYEKVKSLLDKYAVIRPEMQNALDRLRDVPVDIEPIFPLANARQ
jgi:hypothetical protein